jgi:hypothetical protein
VGQLVPSCCAGGELAHVRQRVLDHDHGTLDDDTEVDRPSDMTLPE